jgi:hypothetical protein
VLLSMEVAGIRVCPTQSSLTTTAIRLVSRLHPSRHCMGENVQHLCSGAKPERVVVCEDQERPGGRWMTAPQ